MEGVIDSGSATPTPESSPAPSTPSTVSSSSDRPRSLSAAMAGEADTPDPGTAPPSEPTAPAPTAPVAPETPAPVTDARGPIPFDRHEAILKNAREKANQEAAQRFQQEYGEALQELTAFRQDPGAWLSQAIAEGMANPALSPVITAAAARALAARRGQAQPTAEEPEPQADLQLPDGTPLMSAQRLAEWRTWNDQRLMREFDQKLAPIQEREQRIKAKEQYDAAFTDAKGRMAQVLDRVKSRSHYAEHKSAIHERIKSLMDEGVSAYEAPGIAYAEIVETVVLPAKASAEKQALVQQAVERSKGSTAPPSAVMSSPQSRPRSMAEALRQQGVSSL